MRAQTGSQPLLLEVRINGHPIDRVGEFILRNGVLLVERSELHSLGIRGPIVLMPRASDNPAASDLVSLNDLEGLSWQIDQATQTLYIAAIDARLIPTLLEADESPESIDKRAIQSGTGVTFNYDLVDTLAGGQNTENGSVEMRAFSRKGVLSSDLLAYGGNAPVGRAANRLIRLDTEYSFADVASLRRYSVGDFITGGLGWTRPIRMGGVQVRSDFSMRPDLVTFPLPTLDGSVTVPSTVDVLTNGDSVLARQVDPGPFQISALPVITGTNTITMTVTNALGQQSVVTQPFYASAALLAPGLQTYSVQAGPVRRRWGSASNSYGLIAGMANYRRGLNPFLTFEASGEATPGVAMAGLGGVVRLGNIGVLNASASGNTASGHNGAQFSAGVQRVSRTLSLGVSATVADRYYRDVAAINGSPVSRRQLNGSAELSMHRYGSIGAAYAEVNQDAAPVASSTYALPPQHTAILTASYNRQFGRVSLYANDFEELAGKHSRGLQAGLTIIFGKRTSASLDFNSSDNSGQLQVQKSASEIGQWGYQGYLSSGNGQHAFAQLQHKARWNLMTAGVDSDGASRSLRFESQGAISLVDKALFASNTIFDSFAIVDTSGLPNIRILQEDRDVGVSDHAGRLLVPDMRSFDANHLSIDPDDVPQDASLDITEQTVRPQDRSGVVVHFPTRVNHGALLQLVDASGNPIAVGSTARFLTSGDVFPVGYDGDVYLENLQPKNKLEIKRTDGRRCTVVFDYQAVPGEIPTIGPLACVGAER